MPRSASARVGRGTPDASGTTTPATTLPALGTASRTEFLSNSQGCSNKPLPALKGRPRAVDFSRESERLALIREPGGSVSAYLKFFELEQSPFEGKAQSQVVLGTRALREAFGTIRSGLDQHASRICVSGAPGLGKTSLARALPKLLGDEARVAQVPDAGVPWADCRSTIARQWGLDAGRLSRTALVEARAKQRLVLAIDRAERADEAFLDHLDVLLSYRTEEDAPVVQSVLLANLATGAGGTQAPLLWWLDRIQTLQLELEPLPRDGVASYIAKHLRRAGWRGEALFSEEASYAIHGHAGGFPGEISSLCEKLLVEAASSGRADIDADFVHAICDPKPEGDALTIPDEFSALIAEGDFSGAEDATESTAPGAEGAPVESTDDDDPSTEPQDDEAPWTFSIDGMEPDTDPEIPGMPATDAAFVPEPKTAPDRPLDGPLLEDELPAFLDLSSSMGWKPVALAAVAATIAGLVFLSSGSSGSPGPEPPPMVAKKKEAPATELVLATQGQGYVDPRVLERLPKDALAQAIAAAEAQQPISGWVQDDGARTEAAVHPTTPMRNTTQYGLEAARRDENGPTVQDEAAAKIDPRLVQTSSSAEESPGTETESTPLAKRDPLDPMNRETSPAAMPAVPSATGEEDRFL